ncbi:MAG: YeeE/YedE family protein [Chloroflexia bacterium]|nr:YeeE/YedE family protein [Chloroflexia bacterium]
MMEWLRLARWSPYAVGIGIGVLSWLAFLLSDSTIGCSTAYSRTAGMIERLFRGDKVLQRPYYQKTPPKVEWGWMLVLGIVIGALTAALLSGIFAWQWVPDRWAAQFGAAPLPRLLVAFGGGILMGLGARWAGGCTSGHGISGALQLVIGSWLATICFFIGGIAAAMLIF